MLTIGYTTREHLLLDLDDTDYYKVSRLTRMIMQSWPVGNCLTVQSSAGTGKPFLRGNGKGVAHTVYSRDCYHLVFSAKIGYEHCCKIIETLADLDVLPPGYVDIRNFRGDMTLRLSPKWLIDKTVPMPQPIEVIWNGDSGLRQDGIDEYLHTYAAVHAIFSRVPASTPETRRTGRRRPRTPPSTP